MRAHPASGVLLEAGGESRVVGVAVREHHALDVGEAGAEGVETVPQGGEAGVVPAGVHQDEPASRLDRVDVHRRRHVPLHDDRQPPHAGHRFLERAALPVSGRPHGGAGHRRPAGAVPFNAAAGRRRSGRRRTTCRVR
nr:hypothetical protein GCM10010200_021900 [Actinomadura rugatobispora]